MNSTHQIVHKILGYKFLIAFIYSVLLRMGRILNTLRSKGIFGMNFGDYMVAGRAGISEEVCVILNQFSQLKIKAW